MKKNNMVFNYKKAKSDKALKIHFVNTTKLSTSLANY